MPVPRRKPKPCKTHLTAFLGDAMDEDIQNMIRNLTEGWRDFILGNDIESTRAILKAIPENKDCTDDEIEALVRKNIKNHKRITLENAGEPFFAKYVVTLTNGLLEMIQKDAVGKSCEESLLELQKKHVRLLMSIVLLSKPTFERVDKYSHGPKSFRDKTDLRQNSLFREYAFYRELGLSPENAMIKANNELDKPYGERRLKDLLKKHMPQDWAPD
jgi:hypothetical protein